ncbi:MAG TPA: Ig-like domain-containing protein [Thermoanaerobaculia bacterium]|nr:Ig-like domain-containing protein [Thermoanaerobaculia bacterium]HUM28683.1 Ig-like domain-containing protein [Thermoanaerobaculia bacterium]HXK66709.1 Ig-like domain-containing protein [Thermoanaerobaculia bacterium]
MSTLLLLAAAGVAGTMDSWADRPVKELVSLESSASPEIIPGVQILDALGVSTRTYTVLRSGELLWHVDTPLPEDTVSGVVVIAGWVLSHEGISFIDLYIDGDYVGTANLEVPRDDVIEHYPEYEYTPSRHPGFTVGFNAAAYVDGPHTFHLVVTDANDVQTVIGTRTVMVDNDINPAPRGYLDSPMPSETLGGSYPIKGWVLDEDGIDRIEVIVDGQVAGGAVYGGERPDVYHALPMFAMSGRSGFIYNFDTTRLTSNLHTFRVQAVDTYGMTRILAERTVPVSNNSVNLEPFGLLDWPLRDVTLWGCCDLSGSCKLPGGPSIPPTGLHPLNWVKGWALDVGAREDEGGVAYAELMIDGALLSNTRTDCYFEDNPLIWDYVDCYGLFRPDVQELYVGYVDSPNAGFQFLLDVGDLIANWGFTEGSHHISIRVGDYTDTVTIIDDIPVFFACIDRIDTAPAFGYIDRPASYQAVHGMIHVIGWAIDYDGVVEIRVYVDGDGEPYSPYIEADYGWSRPDVYSSFEASIVGLYSGWDTFIDTTLLSDGEHEIVVEVLDRKGHTSIVGERRFVVDNVEVK